MWIGWVIVLAAVTAHIFKWHLDYFSSPGPEFHRIAVVLLPALAIIGWIYSGVRGKKIVRFEPVALLILIAGACFFYEPRASLVTAAFFLACTGAGRFVLRKVGITLENPIDRLAVGFGAGAGMLIPIMFTVGLMGWFYPSVFAALLILPAVLFWREIFGVAGDVRAILDSWAGSADVRHPLAGVAMVFGAVAVVCSLMVILAPSISFDSVAYHLPLAQYYAEHHALTPVPGIDYSYYPQGMEILWALGYSLAGQAGARLLSGLFFFAFLMILFRIGRACGLDTGAALMGVIFAGTLPFLHWAGSVVKNDTALAFFESLALYMFLRWLETGNFGSIAAGAFFLAEAFGIKLIALFGAVPLAVLFGYAVWKQPRRWRAAAIVVTIGVVFGTCWAVRTYLLTGNPVYPDRLGLMTQGTLDVPVPSTLGRLRHYAKIPWSLMFRGQWNFESPLPNPAGIVWFAFAPLAVLAGPWRSRLRSMTKPQIACAAFGAANLILWAWVITKVRYAMLPLALLTMLMGAWAKRFYDSQAERPVVKASLIGVEIYCLSIALMGLMIVGVNGPQLAYFSGRLDRAGYLRAAMHAYPAVEFLNTSAGPHPRIFGVENVARGYAADPPKFDGVLCEEPQDCQPETLLRAAAKDASEYLILPENGMDFSGILKRFGSPDRIYGDAYFTVYDLRKVQRPWR